MLILALTLVHMRPVEFGQIELVPIRVVESGKLTGLSLVAQPVESHATALQRLHCVLDLAGKLEPDRRATPSFGGSRLLVGGMQTDREPLAQFDTGPMITEAIGQLQAQGARSISVT
jgi:hypothetical protein